VLPLRREKLKLKEWCTLLKTQALLGKDKRQAPSRQIWRSAAHTHVNEVQMLRSKCLRIATDAPWDVSNKQIDENSGIPFFADHI
jgi:hypothetical protein